VDGGSVDGGPAEQLDPLLAAELLEHRASDLGRAGGEPVADGTARRLFAEAVDAWRGPEAEPADTAFLCVTESAIIGFSHIDAGADLLRFWGLPAPVIEAVAGHAATVQPGAVVDAPSAVALAHMVVEFEMGPVCGPGGTASLNEDQFDDRARAAITRWRRERRRHQQ
jgi:hypothetical protein